MTSADPPATARLTISLASALVAVTVFLLLALPFGVARLTSPAPAPIFLGAMTLTIVMPFVRALVAGLVERNPRWASPESYEHIARGARLEWDPRPGTVLSELAELAHKSVGGSSAQIQAEIGRSESGTPAPVPTRAAVMYRGAEIANITVTSSERLTSPQQVRLEQLASSVGVVVANAVAIDGIEKRISELDRTIELVISRRRSVVEVEAAERARVARDVASGARPIFERLLSSVADANYDQAAEACDHLIVFLRGFSTAMRER